MLEVLCVTSEVVWEGVPKVRGLGGGRLGWERWLLGGGVLDLERRGFFFLELLAEDFSLRESERG